MVIGGLQKISLSDFPGVISTILFTQGCSFRCPWCHNPELVEPSLFGPSIPWEKAAGFLQTRRGRIEGVVVTGGEPTIHADLPGRLAEIKALGFKVKLDTNGSNPGMLRGLLASGLLDFIAMDIKAPLGRYEELAGVKVADSDISQSIGLVLGSAIPYEFRTTLVPLLSMGDLDSMAELVRGCSRYVLQAFRAGGTLQPGFAAAARAAVTLKDAVDRLAAAGLSATAR
jgi:pyruvate formate lyase activating enzyme